MLHLWTAFLLLCIGGAQADCYYPTQTYSSTWNTIYFINPYDASSGQPIIGCCNVTADSSDPTKGFTHLQLASNSNSAGWVFTIYDVLNGAKTYTSFDNSVYNYITTSSVVTFQICTTLSNVKFMATMTIANTLGAQVTSTTPAGTTAAYDYGNNPATVAADVLFAVDVSRGTDNVSQERATLAYKIASQLSLTTDYNDKLKSRITIASLSSLAGTYGPYGTTWGVSSDQLNSTLQSLPFSFPEKSNWKQTILNALDAVFKVDSSSPTVRTRKNSQRAMYIIASDSPVDTYDSIKNIPFDSYDVYPVFVTYKVNDANGFFNSLKNTAKMNVINCVDLNCLIHDIFSASLGNGNQLCPDDDAHTQNLDTFSSDKSYTFAEPHEYNGAFETHTTWNLDQITYQTGRYCNYMDTTYPFNTTKSYSCFRVYYELEVEKDFLRFYDATNQKNLELASLTGMDVSGTIIQIPNSAGVGSASIVNVNFKTDGSQVYSGFHISAWSSDNECGATN